MEGQARPQYHVMIRDLPTGERPRERLRDHGPTYLSNAELIAILLRTGTTSENVVALATRLLSQYGGLEGLSKASFQELSNQHGMGEAKTSQLKAALELGKRLLSTSDEQRVAIHSPQDVANLLMAEMAFLDQEHLRVLLLNTKNQVLGISEVYKGNVNSSVIRHPRGRGVSRGGTVKLPFSHRCSQSSFGRSEAQPGGCPGNPSAC